MLTDQFTEDFIQNAIDNIDFSSLDYDSLDFVSGEFDNVQLMITQGYKSKDVYVNYPLIMYILPEPSKININKSDVNYRSQTVRLFLLDKVSENYTFSEFKTNVLSKLGALKIAFLESLNRLHIQKIEEVDEYIHKWLSIKATWLSGEDVLKQYAGGYELSFTMEIKKKYECN